MPISVTVSPKSNRFLLLLLSGSAALLMACSCGGGGGSNTANDKADEKATNGQMPGDHQKAEQRRDKKDAATHDSPTHAFGERVRVGDLVITIGPVKTDRCAGQLYGRFTPIDLLVVQLSIENTSQTKIVDWNGWQGKAKIEDEHGNKFAPVDLTGWSCLPHNNTFGDGWNGDFGTRIHPGRTYVNALYHQSAPPSSKHIAISVPSDGKILRFIDPSLAIEKAALKIAERRAAEERERQRIATDKGKREAKERAALHAKGPAGLSAMLNDNQPESRQRAAVALGELGEASATVVPDLAAALKDGSAGVRREVAMALGKVGPAGRKALPALLAAEGDSDPT